MKKVALILLLCIYALFSVGVSFKAFYCCGELKYISASFTDIGTSKTGKDDGCCKTSYQYFKVKDTHLASGDFSLPEKNAVDLPLFSTLYQTTSFLSLDIHIINGSHAPPLYTGIPVYISNCVFLI